MVSVVWGPVQWPVLWRVAGLVHLGAGERPVYRYSLAAPSKKGLVAVSCHPSTWEAAASEFQASLCYRMKHPVLRDPKQKTGAEASWMGYVLSGRCLELGGGGQSAGLVCMKLWAHPWHQAWYPQHLSTWELEASLGYVRPCLKESVNTCVILSPYPRLLYGCSGPAVGGVNSCTV